MFTHSVIRHLRAVAALPGVVIIVIPCIILAWSSGWHGLSAVPTALQFAIVVVGATLATVGLILMIKTISLFVRVGSGTLAPWDPTKYLVVQGIYRRVRNPMISGVALVLLGEAVLFTSSWLFGWFFVFALANVAYIPVVEEQGLVRRFGNAYLEYRRNVPRWIPRIPPQPRF